MLGSVDAIESSDRSLFQGLILLAFVSEVRIGLFAGKKHRIRIILGPVRLS